MNILYIFYLFIPFYIFILHNKNLKMENSKNIWECINQLPREVERIVWLYCNDKISEYVNWDKIPIIIICDNCQKDLKKNEWFECETCKDIFCKTCLVNH